jgi:hypothetical protein
MGMALGWGFLAVYTIINQFTIYRFWKCHLDESESWIKPSREALRLSSLILYPFVWFDLLSWLLELIFKWVHVSSHYNFLTNTWGLLELAIMGFALAILGTVWAVRTKSLMVTLVSILAVLGVLTGHRQPIVFLGCVLILVDLVKSKDKLTQQKLS